MVSLHKHGGSRRQSKGWEVCKPRQEGMERGGGLEWIPVDGALSALRDVSAAGVNKGDADR